MEDNSDYIDDFKPTAIFWDIENINKKSDELRKFIDSIRSDLIVTKQLEVIQFTCVYGAGRLNDEKKSLLKENSINTIECVTGKPEVADLQLIKLIDDFVATYKCESIIILISGDGDFIKRLVKHKDDHNLTIFTVHKNHRFSYYLDAIADENFTITNDGLVSITDRLNVCAVKVTGLPDDLDRNEFKSHLIEMFSYIGGSKEAIYFDCENHCYWINFECNEMARLVVATKNASKYLNFTLTLEYIREPPDDVVKKLFRLDVDQTVRRKKMNIIRTAISCERELSWKKAKNAILPLKIIAASKKQKKKEKRKYLINKKSKRKKRKNLVPCVLVSGLPGMFSRRCTQYFFWNHFNTLVKVFWENNGSVAFYRMKDLNMIQLIEAVNRSKLHPAWKLKATLFYIYKDLPEFRAQQKFWCRMEERMRENPDASAYPLND